MTTSILAANDKVVLVHLSDIHFRKRLDAGNTVLDEDVRRELLRDVVEVVGGLGKAHGILVTGDLAYAGRREEFQQAENWLFEVCKGTGCPEENIYLICGNHDVQRDVIDASMALRHFQSDLRTCGSDQIDAKFGEYLGDAVYRAAIFSPLQNYNDFARKFECHFTSDQLFWEEDIILNDGSKLRLRGTNSALGSNRDDHIENAKLSLGSARCAVTRDDACEYLLLCHHPPDWLRDADQVTSFLDSRVRIQLFGHKHKLRINESKVHDFSCIKLHAGAVNPDRDGVTMPRYHCLVIHVETDFAAKKRTLCVEIHPRQWNSDQTRFVPDTAECGGTQTCRLFQLPLDWFDVKPLLRQQAAAPVSDVISHTKVSDPLNIVATANPLAPSMKGSRRLIFRFLSLPFHQRMEVASQLGLLEASDSHADDTELFRRLFRRAAERTQLRAFFEAVEIKHDGKPPLDNPFS